jgi:hypothetical protein
MYDSRVAPNGTTFIPDFVNVGIYVQKLKGRIYKPIRHSDLIGLLSFEKSGKCTKKLLYLVSAIF